jgi:hypothetical protein
MSYFSVFKKCADLGKSLRRHVKKDDQLHVVRDLFESRPYDVDALAQLCIKIFQL